VSGLYLLVALAVVVVFCSLIINEEEK